MCESSSLLGSVAFWRARRGGREVCVCDSGSDAEVRQCVCVCACLEREKETERCVGVTHMLVEVARRS